MRAAIFECVGQPLKIETLPDLTPGAGEVVLKIHRCGICGTDLHMTDGHSAPPAPAGSVLGHEYAGEVVARGRDVQGLAIGDRVSAMPLRGCGSCRYCLAGEPVWCAAVRPNFGGFAEYALITPASCVKLPASLSFDDGALVEPLSVALHGVLKAGTLLGRTVLVMGAGPIGLGVVFWARRMGAARITVIEGSVARTELAYAMGATVCQPPAAADAAAFSGDELGGPVNVSEMPEVVFECVGKPGLLGQAIAYARPRGAVVSLGFCMRADRFVPASAGAKELTLHFPVAWTLAEFQTAMDAMDAGAVEPRQMVTEVVSLDAAPAAFEALRSAAVNCKVLVAP
jgi:2-desacetyl-2-hydroxyethyl bacteriochlorophyllide A dehydrogenase